MPRTAPGETHRSASALAQLVGKRRRQEAADVSAAVSRACALASAEAAGRWPGPWTRPPRGSGSGRVVRVKVRFDPVESATVRGAAAGFSWPVGVYATRIAVVVAERLGSPVGADHRLLSAEQRLQRVGRDLNALVAASLSGAVIADGSRLLARVSAELRAVGLALETGEPARVGAASAVAS